MLPCPVIDTMLQIPVADDRGWYDFMQPLFMDEKSRNYAKMPAEHLFGKNIPELTPGADPVAFTVEQLDRYGISRAMIGAQHPVSQDALRRYPDRFFASWHANPNRGMDEVRAIVRAKDEFDIKAVTAFPAGTNPQVALDDARWYPIYSKCIELDIAFACTVGVPGPRIPMWPQTVERIDNVCWFFPELRFVMRHGALPDVGLAIALMLKYEHLYYSTSAMAPRHYPREILDFANTRGAKKLIFAGYWPMGLGLDRITSELAELPLREHVWKPFLHDNAVEVFRL